jgi:hypothetical protein
MPSLTAAPINGGPSSNPGGPLNSTGLPSLAVETLHEIISYLLEVPVPCSTESALGPEYLERVVALHALAETCRRLRSVFLAHAWQRLEVCASTKAFTPKVRTSPCNRFKVPWPRTVAKELATELVRQCEKVSVRVPALAKHVRYVVPHLLTPGRILIALQDCNGCADRVFRKDGLPRVLPCPRPTAKSGHGADFDAA